jgi:hypothetical protein
LDALINNNLSLTNQKCISDNQYDNVFYFCVTQVLKKLAGQGANTAEWCTNIANENCQILNSIVTCKESVAALKPLADGLMDCYERSSEPTPKLLYVDRGCCRQLGSTAVEQLFDRWTDDGMIVRLDISSSFDLPDCWPHL